MTVNKSEVITAFAVQCILFLVLAPVLYAVAPESGEAPDYPGIFREALPVVFMLGLGIAILILQFFTEASSTLQSILMFIGLFVCISLFNVAYQDGQWYLKRLLDPDFHHFKVLGYGTAILYLLALNVCLVTSFFALASEFFIGDGGCLIRLGAGLTALMLLVSTVSIAWFTIKTFWYVAVIGFIILAIIGMFVKD